jgi:hypothetical protein
MEVRIHYSKTQMEATVRFIAEHNKSFLGQYDYIRKSIEHHIDELGQKFPHMVGVGTMGYYISVGHSHQEGIDNEDNEIILDFSVDPAVGDDAQYTDEDGVDLIINSNSEPLPPIIE